MDLLRSVMVSLVMQALGGKIQGFQRKSCPSSVNKRLQTPQLKSHPTHPSIHFVSLHDSFVGMMGGSVSVPALPEVSPSRGSAIVASLFGRAIISMHSGRAASE